MSTKLIVHKFETGTDFKSLRIIIDEENNGVAKFSDWTEGESYQSKKNGEKSRLIIKLVSGEVNYFNLDACAKSAKNLEILYKENPPVENKSERSNVATAGNSNIPNRDPANDENIYNASQNFDNMRKFFIRKNENGQDSTNNLFDNVNPLEYSLARVKANNARIMENILLLNRTLDYAKKREMLEATCPKTLKSYPCVKCGKCFVYETGLKRHYAMRHAMLEFLPRWQDVWTCVECFQVWPRKDVAIEHAKNCNKDETDTNKLREIKTSLLLQCEFCERVFTSIPRLLKHAKLHTTKSNYECHACKLAFTSYKEAEHHWTTCTWLKLYYDFSLPKMLLCNACDRKFRNYEQLYNHRYKAGHFITKTHNQSTMNKSLGILVYQCEICGMWFPFITPLQNHRKQSHPFYESGNQIKLKLCWHGSPGNLNNSNNVDDIIDVM